MTTWAIGDLQGCYNVFRNLLDAINFQPGEDRLWLCGDLVNRGGQSLETLRLVYELREHVQVVLGNHDLSLLAISLRTGNEQRRVNEDLQRILFAPDAPELLDWLRQQPLFHADKSIGWAMVHAGLSPRWRISDAQQCADDVQQRLSKKKSGDKLLQQMFGNSPSAWTPRLRGTQKARATINVMTRMRFCSPRGTIDFQHKAEPGTQQPGFYPWFQAPGVVRRELRMVCGHWSALGLMITPQVCAIDTGAVWGGKLTALSLDDSSRDVPRVVQVLGKPR